MTLGDAGATAIKSAIKRSAVSVWARRVGVGGFGVLPHFNFAPENFNTL